MKVVLEFDGDEENFMRAFDSMDDNFNINDNVFWEICYGEDGSYHCTEFGDIKIKVERSKQYA